MTAVHYNRNIHTEKIDFCMFSSVSKKLFSINILVKICRKMISSLLRMHRHILCSLMEEAEESMIVTASM